MTLFHLGFLMTFSNHIIGLYSYCYISKCNDTESDGLSGQGRLCLGCVVDVWGGVVCERSGVWEEWCVGRVVCGRSDVSSSYTFGCYGLL